MELEDFYKWGDLEVRTSKNYAFVCCPLMDGAVDFGTKRRLYRDLKALEKHLKDDFREITLYTKLKNAHMMRMATKLGYKPFHISLEYDALWFKKETRYV